MASRYKGHSGSYFTGNNRLLKLSNKHSRTSTEPKSPILPTPPTPPTHISKSDLDSINTSFFENLVSSTNYLKHIIADLKSQKSLKNQEKKSLISALRQELNTLDQF